MTHPRLTAIAVVIVVATGCVGPSRTEDDFARKAANTAEAAESAVNTARLAVRTAARDRAFGPFLSVTLRNAEEDADAAQQSFDAVQPPSDAADQLRAALDQLLDDAAATLTDLRIAVRRGELDKLTTIASPLDGLAQHLADFQVAHG